MKATKGAGALLRLRKVSRTYGSRRALHPLDLDLVAGQCVALYGQNGSGKSTLLRIAAGRDAPTSGDALFAGRAVSEDDPEVRARVAVVGDTVACYPDLTVREHLELVTVAHAVDDADAWIDQVLADRRLSDHARALPGSLSSGQLQSLLLAAALVRPRDLLILDEPEQRLDPAARRRLADLLVAEKARRRRRAAGHPPARPGRGGRRPDDRPGRRPGHRRRAARGGAPRAGRPRMTDGLRPAPHDARPPPRPRPGPGRRRGPGRGTDGAPDPARGQTRRWTRARRPGTDGAGVRRPDRPDGTGDAAAPDGRRPDEDEDVPWSEEDDDRTDETLAWLRRKRRAHRRAKGRELAVLVYTVLIAVAGYGSSFAVSFLRGLEDGSGYADAAATCGPRCPRCSPCSPSALAVLAARDALWRGPGGGAGPGRGVAAGAAGAARPGAAPVVPAVGRARADPRRAGRGRRRVGAAGDRAGPARHRDARRAARGPVPAAAGGRARHGGGAPARGRPRGTAVDRARRAAAGRAVAQTVLAATGHRSPAVEQVELWSGPWGWAGQPVVGRDRRHRARLARRRRPARGGHRRRAARRVPRRGPRPHRPAARARRHRDDRLLGGLVARTARRQAGDHGRGRRHHRSARCGCGRRAAATGRHLVVAWRDLLTLLRTPGRLGKAALWTACGAAVAGLGADLGGERRWVGLVIGLLLGYLAVGALAEPARLETDDVRRAAWAPYRFRTLMLHHGIVPAVLGAVLGLLAAVPYAVAGHTWALLLLPLCAPPFTAAALVSAAAARPAPSCSSSAAAPRSAAPGPLIYLAWYAAGPLISVTALALVLDPALVDAPSPAPLVLVTALLTALLLLLTTRAADRLMRT